MPIAGIILKGPLKVKEGIDPVRRVHAVQGAFEALLANEDDTEQALSVFCEHASCLRHLAGEDKFELVDVADDDLLTIEAEQLSEDVLRIWSDPDGKVVLHGIDPDNESQRILTAVLEDDYCSTLINAYVLGMLDEMGIRVVTYNHYGD